MTREHILDEIRRTTAANHGKPFGFKRFEQVTGIRYADWFGRYWKGWGEALQEAGFQPNALQGRIHDDHLLERFTALIRELGRFPVKGDLRLRRRRDPTFPNDKVFDRFGHKAQLVARVREYCNARPDLTDLIPLLPTPLAPGHEAISEPNTKPVVVGYVYLLRSARFYKIGRSVAFGRRERELAIQLPEKPNTVHVIKTDDPEGIEAYWHRRFADKRAHGEWFRLTPEDVTAFKRRRFQ